MLLPLQGKYAYSYVVSHMVGITMYPTEPVKYMYCGLATLCAL